MKKTNTWETYDSKKLKKLEKICEEYRAFLDASKTERECVDFIVNACEEAGYREMESIIKSGEKLSVGDKVYRVWMNKTIVLFQVGEEGKHRTIGQ